MKRKDVVSKGTYSDPLLEELLERTRGKNWRVKDYGNGTHEKKYHVYYNNHLVTVLSTVEELEKLLNEIRGLSVMYV